MGQELLAQSISEEGLLVDHQMSGIIPAPPQEGNTLSTYTEEKGNIYQGDIGQGDGPGLVPLTVASVPITATPLIQVPQRTPTQYFISQVICA